MKRITMIRELWEFVHARKKYYLFPILILMLLLGALIIINQHSAIAPFIYAIF